MQQPEDSKHQRGNAPSKHQGASVPVGEESRVSKVVSAVENFTAKIEPVLAQGDDVGNELFVDLKYVAEMLQEKYSPAEERDIMALLAASSIPETLPVTVARLETQLEKAQARRLLDDMKAQGQLDFNQFILYDKYKNLVRKEWLLLQQVHSHADLLEMRFAFVGCGGMPLTAIGFAKTFGVKVDCFDIDPGAAALATELVDALGMQSLIRVERKNALDIDYSPYGVVIVANLAQPRMKILKRIGACKSVKALITRRVVGIVSLMYSGLDVHGLTGTGLSFHSTADPNDKTSVHQSVLLTLDAAV